MGIVEKDRKCCMHCLYWHGCLVIAKNLDGFVCSTCYCEFFEVDDKPTILDKLKKNDWVIPEIIHAEVK